MKVGIDLVKISRFKKAAMGELGKVFLKSELEQNPRAESLAGIFAAKEAFFKAIGKKGDWLSVCIDKQPSGKPVVLSAKGKAEVSISHDGEYAIAIVLIK